MLAQLQVAVVAVQPEGVTSQVMARRWRMPSSSRAAQRAVAGQQREVDLLSPAWLRRLGCGAVGNDVQFATLKFCLAVFSTKRHGALPALRQPARPP